MLKKLLKYEFRATARTYGGMYLALLAASVLFGGSVRRWNGTNSDAYSTLVGLLSLVYTAVIIGTVVVTIMTIVQRFYRNLLGREGYLMHTLPVTETQACDLEAHLQHRVEPVQHPRSLPFLRHSGCSDDGGYGPA